MPDHYLVDLPYRLPVEKLTPLPVIPIHELLHRIRWDQEFGAAEFVIGYYDRVENRVVQVYLRELYFDPEDHFDFELIDAEGVHHAIPLHRIREVYRNGKLIWHRDVD